MSKLRHPGIFRFCAIPQVMAIATLAEIYNNPRVFTGDPWFCQMPRASPEFSEVNSLLSAPEESRQPEHVWELEPSLPNPWEQVCSLYSWHETGIPIVAPE
jgi:hypothetical protein